MPQWKIKAFKELSLDELYECLRLRSEVFISEQNCVYNDVDNKDQVAFHLTGVENGKTVAYARLFDQGKYFDLASIGRVVVAQDSRSKAYGHELMKEAISGIKTLFGSQRIKISAQLYLKKFYESHGFVAVGDQYLEDDIPHIQMIRD